MSAGGGARDLLVLLAGGRSTRMGRDKALVDLGDGEPLVLRVLRRLAPLAPRAVVVRAAPLAGLPAHAVRFADPAPGSGPLQAMHAAFAAHPAMRWFVAPCDLPWLDARTYDALAVAAGSDGVACARRGDRLEPLVAVWTAAACARLAALGAESSVASALTRLCAATVAFDEADPRFLNVNTPHDLELANSGSDA